MWHFNSFGRNFRPLSTDHFIRTKVSSFPYSSLHRVESFDMMPTVHFIVSEFPTIVDSERLPISQCTVIHVKLFHLQGIHILELSYHFFVKIVRLSTKYCYLTWFVH